VQLRAKVHNVEEAAMKGKLTGSIAMIATLAGYLGIVLTASSFLIFNSSNALAQLQTVQLVSKATGKCLSLQAPDQNDGGGLTTKDCQNFSDFFVTLTNHFSETELQFRLNSSRFVCVFASEPPVLGGKVMTRNCVGANGIGLRGSLWNVRTGDLVAFEKLNGFDSTNLCMQVNSQTSDFEFAVCQGVPEQNWKLQPVPGQ
jgi:hypothetical protein